MSELEKLWLLTRGDRNEWDVIYSDDGKERFVMMGDGYGGYEMVKVPKEEEMDYYTYQTLLRVRLNRQVRRVKEFKFFERING